MSGPEVSSSTCQSHGTRDGVPLGRPVVRSAINWRSVSLGLLGTLIICCLSPYNDFALNNTYLVGNSLPVGVVTMLFLFALLVNGPLSRFAPGHAFSSGELAVALSMTLVSCVIPGSGLHRYFIPSLVMPFWHARGNPEFLALLQSFHLPEWLFPGFTTGHTPQDWMNDPVVTGYHVRWTSESPYPYLAWLRPAITWGVFIAALFGSLLCIVALIRRQWYENERLSFPLAHIQLALIEQPAGGQWFNALFRARAFWVAFGLVFFVHLWNGCAKYWPRNLPSIPLEYDLKGLFTEPPFQYIDGAIQAAPFYFIAAGVTFFLSSSVAFSLWFTFIVISLGKIAVGSAGGETSFPWRYDQHFGAVVAFAVSMLWIGRQHWGLVLRQALRGRRDGEPRGRYLSYPTAVWGLVVCIATMVVWLMLAGATFLGAVAPVLMLLMLFTVVTRVSAETGLVYTGLAVPTYAPMSAAANAGWRDLFPVKDFYLASFLQSVHYDYREPLPIYAANAIKVDDQAIFQDQSQDERRLRRLGRQLVALMVLSLVVGYFSGFVSHLWVEYRYSSSLDTEQTTPINSWGADENSMSMMVGPTVNYSKTASPAPYSRMGYWFSGFGVTSLLSFLRLRFAWWPLHPIGFVLWATNPVPRLWFSIFIGWLAKALLLRLGGARLYSQARPFFLGLIVGESVAAGFWLVVALFLSSLNIPYQVIRVMPT